jgi:hypothetical protein
MKTNKLALLGAALTGLSNGIGGAFGLPPAPARIGARFPAERQSDTSILAEALASIPITRRYRPGIKTKPYIGNALCAIKGQRALNRLGRRRKAQDTSEPGWRFRRKLMGGGKHVARIDRRLRRERRAQAAASMTPPVPFEDIAATHSALLGGDV